MRGGVAEEEVVGGVELGGGGGEGVPAVGVGCERGGDDVVEFEFWEGGWVFLGLGLKVWRGLL